MKIMLEIMGPAKRKIEKNPSEVDIPDGSNILDLMKFIGYTDTEAKFLTYIRGEERLKLYDSLKEGDFIKAVLQVGGG